MKKINFIDSITHPIITEKATILSEQNKTVFKVHEKANKKVIKKNIEKLFKVNVVKVVLELLLLILGIDTYNINKIIPIDATGKIQTLCCFLFLRLK